MHAQSSWDPNAAWDDSSQQNVPSHTAVSMPTNAGGYGMGDQSWNPDASWNQGQQNYGYTAAAGDQSDRVSPSAVSPTADTTQNAQKKVGAMPAPEFYKSKDPKASQILTDPLIRPTDGGPIALLTWRVCYPIHFLCQKTGRPPFNLVQFSFRVCSNRSICQFVSREQYPIAEPQSIEIGTVSHSSFQCCGFHSIRISW